MCSGVEWCKFSRCHGVNHAVLRTPEWSPTCLHCTRQGQILQLVCPDPWLGEVLALVLDSSDSVLLLQNHPALLQVVVQAEGKHLVIQLERNEWVPLVHVHSVLVFLERDINVKTAGLKVSWRRVCYWSLTEHGPPYLSVVFQFDCRHLCSAKKARTCIYVGLKREQLPLTAFLLCWSLFLFGLGLSSFPTVRLLFTIMWKTLQSLVQFLEDLSLLLLPVTTVPSGRGSGSMSQAMGLNPCWTFKWELCGFVGKGLMMGWMFMRLMIKAELEYLFVGCKYCVFFCVLLMTHADVQKLSVVDMRGCCMEGPWDGQQWWCCEQKPSPSHVSWTGTSLVAVGSIPSWLFIKCFLFPVIWRNPNVTQLW